MTGQSTIRRWRWLVLGGLIILTVVLGYAGFAIHLRKAGVPGSFWDLAYLTIQLFPLQSGGVKPPINALLQAARFLAPALSVFALIEAFLALFRQQIARVRFRWVRGHAIVVGLGRKGLLLAGRFRGRGMKVVAIECDTDAPGVAEARDAGLPVLFGDAADPGVLRRAGIRRAKHLIAVAGEDGVNVGSALRAAELGRSRRARPLSCFVHVVDPALCRLLREREIDLERYGAFEVEFFNLYDRGALALLRDNPLPDDPNPHLVIVGFGRLGRSLALHAARKHRNRVLPAGGGRMKITVVDRNDATRVERLKAEFPRLADTCDIVTVRASLTDPAFVRGDFLRGPGGRVDASLVAICLGDAGLALQATLDLAPHIRGTSARIVTRLSSASALRGLIDPGDPAIRTFDLYDRTCRPDEILGGTHDTIARALHASYLAAQWSLGRSVKDNPALVPWEDLDEGSRDSNRDQARHVGEKLRAVGARAVQRTDWDAPDFAFPSEEIERLARMEHDRWVKERSADGWRYAPGEKNPKRKTHPYLVPWEELSEDIREYDRCFIRELPRILAGVDLQIVRI